MCRTVRGPDVVLPRDLFGPHGASWILHFWTDHIDRSGDCRQKPGFPSCLEEPEVLNISWATQLDSVGRHGVAVPSGGRGLCGCHSPHPALAPVCPAWLGKDVGSEIPGGPDTRKTVRFSGSAGTGRAGGQQFPMGAPCCRPGPACPFTLGSSLSPGSRLPDAQARGPLCAPPALV